MTWLGIVSYSVDVLQFDLQFALLWYSNMGNKGKKVIWSTMLGPNMWISTFGRCNEGTTMYQPYEKTYMSSTLTALYTSTWNKPIPQCKGNCLYLNLCSFPQHWVTLNIGGWVFIMAYYWTPLILLGLCWSIKSIYFINVINYH